MKKFLWNELFYVGLAVGVLTGCTDHHTKAEEFYRNVELLKINWGEICTARACTDEQLAAVLKDQETMRKVLKTGHVVPAAWEVPAKESDGSDLPNSLPLNLVSEWGTKITISADDRYLKLQVDVPQSDCALLAESLSIEVKSLQVNDIAVLPSVNGSALKLATDLCKSGNNKFVIAI